MIDEKMLANLEWAASQVGGNMDAEIIRLARRYLALRESGKYSPGVFGNEWDLRMTGARLTESERIQLDASADRLLENES